MDDAGVDDAREEGPSDEVEVEGGGAGKKSLGWMNASGCVRSALCRRVSSDIRSSERCSLRGLASISTSPSTKHLNHPTRKALIQHNIPHIKPCNMQRKRKLRESAGAQERDEPGQEGARVYQGGIG